MTHRHLYEFEASHRSLAADTDGKHYTKLCHNLNLTSTLSASAIALLQNYVATVHANANWYNQHVKRMWCLRRTFLVGSIILLLATPLLVLYLSTRYSDGGGALVTLLSASLSGFYGAHRAVAAWFNQRKLLGPYWQARSELLSEIYSLETKWHAQPKLQPGGVLCADFATDLRAGIRKARHTVATERKAFFTTYSMPDLNLAQISSAASSAAGSAVSTFWSPSATQQSAQTETLAELLAERDGLAAARDRIAAKLTALATQKNTATDEQRHHLEVEINALEKVLHDDLVQAIAKNAINLATAQAKSVSLE